MKNVGFALQKLHLKKLHLCLSKESIFWQVPNFSADFDFHGLFEALAATLEDLALQFAEKSDLYALDSDIEVLGKLKKLCLKFDNKFTGKCLGKLRNLGFLGTLTSEHTNCMLRQLQ